MRQLVYNKNGIFTHSSKVKIGPEKTKTRKPSGLTLGWREAFPMPEGLMQRHAAMASNTRLLLQRQQIVVDLAEEEEEEDLFSDASRVRWLLLLSLSSP